MARGESIVLLHAGDGTEMRKTEHANDRGIKAEKGIEH